MINDTREAYGPVPMHSIQMDIPDWTAEHIASKSRDLGISANELIRALVCSDVRTYDPHGARYFTVPTSMLDLFPSERSMVVGRQDGSVTLTPTDYVPSRRSEPTDSTRSGSSKYSAHPR